MNEKFYFIQAPPFGERSAVQDDIMSLENEDVNTSKRSDNEILSSEKEEFEEINLEDKVERPSGKAIDGYIGGMKIQGFPMTLPGDKTQGRNTGKLRTIIEIGPKLQNKALITKVKPKTIANSLFDPKVKLKIIGVPTNIIKPKFLNIISNNTKLETEDGVENSGKVDNVDYSQLEGALQGYLIDSDHRDALRKSWRKGCDKKAAKSCIMACAKSVRSVRASKDFTKVLKRECKHSCSILFTGDSSLGSDSDSSSESSDCDQSNDDQY